MEIRIFKEAENPLLKRREIGFEVKHAGKSTPSMFEVREELSALKNAPIEAVYVLSIRSTSGKRSSIGEAHVYYSPEHANIEPTHIKVANLPPQEKRRKKDELKKIRMETKAKAAGGRR